MILAVFDKQELGVIKAKGKIRITRNDNTEWHKQPVVFIREATYEEWVECAINEFNCNMSELPSIEEHRRMGIRFYYEARTD